MNVRPRNSIYIQKRQEPPSNSAVVQKSPKHTIEIANKKKEYNLMFKRHNQFYLQFRGTRCFSLSRGV